ncbi:hypothetical protein ACRE_059600 [Hapsidospora chrysogenum ATCC 11550]|uniref:Uncharacterized protein n=1 Tax=Hapsidospora chrysogenum (strain ATCC 11550 / CBS 779.69 / DSM 880 / IAM 14645 / JCM 23072 / IMI 49137) TaxID=857340 RepID=A0A086T1R7_HAPC1|nr:hypothetical protein ACRE_059600 [Hapsidospora chrysogenum ATCC 11550]
MKSTVALAIMAASADALLNLDVKLPLGIEVDLDLLGARPETEPCAECDDTWHPPHDVIIDDCDDLDNGDWHWIHPCPDHPEPSYTWSTSTITATQTSTIISCAPEVPDCPASSTIYTTVTVPEQTTICPAPVHPTPAVPTSDVDQPQPPPETEVPAPPQETHVPPPQEPEVPPQEPEVPPQEPYVPATEETDVVPGPPAPPAPTPYVPPVTLVTSVNTPPYHPTAPVVPGPPAETDVTPPVVQPPPGNNGTIPAPPPPAPTAGAAQNVQSMGLSLVAGLAVIALL